MHKWAVRNCPTESPLRYLLSDTNYDWWATSPPTLVIPVVNDDQLTEQDRVTPIIDELRSHGEDVVADRIENLYTWSFEDDDEAPMSVASLIAATAFIHDRLRIVKHAVRVPKPVIGIAQSAIWLNYNGEVELLWETGDKDLSINDHVSHQRAGEARHRR